MSWNFQIHSSSLKDRFKSFEKHKSVKKARTDIRFVPTISMQKLDIELFARYGAILYRLSMGGLSRQVEAS